MQSLHQLLRDAQSGNVAAVEQLVSDFSPIIEQECARYGLWQHPDWSHSDLMQEVILQVWTKLDQFNGTNADNPDVVFGQWIRSTARNVLTSLHRHRTAKKRRPETPPNAFDEMTQVFSNNRKPDPSASSIFARDEEVERIQQAMNHCLDETGKQVLILRIVDGLTLKQISERLTLSYDQVRYKFEISLLELQKQLAQP